MYTIENPPICIVCHDRMTMIPESTLRHAYTQTYGQPYKGRNDAPPPIVWACKPFSTGFIARECHYQVVFDDDDKMVYERIELSPYMVRNYRDHAVISRSRDQLMQAVCTIEHRLDTSDFNADKFLNKLKTYVVFS